MFKTSTKGRWRMRKMFIVLLIMSWLIVGFGMVYSIGYKNGSKDTGKSANEWWIDQQKKRFYFKDDIFKKRVKKGYNLI